MKINYKKAVVKDFGKHGMQNSRKQSPPAYRIEGKTKNADIYNEFGAAFSNALLIQQTISCY